MSRALVLLDRLLGDKLSSRNTPLRDKAPLNTPPRPRPLMPPLVIPRIPPLPPAAPPRIMVPTGRPSLA